LRRQRRFDDGRTGRWRDRSRALDAVRANIEHPTHQYRDRKTEYDQGDDQGDGPLRKMQARQHGRGDFDDNPADDRVHHDDAEHPAATQFREEIGNQ
jgi:hypothetical protein